MVVDVQSDSLLSKSPSRNPSVVVPTVSNRTVWWKRLLVLCVVLVAIGASAYMTFGAKSSKESGPKLTHEVLRRDLQVKVTEQGTLESSKNTEVRCKVKGANSTIVWIAENGTQVKPGDELVRLDTSTIETNINAQQITYQNALAAYAQAKSDVAVAEINITEYVEGTFRSELKTKEKDVAIAHANLRSAQNMLNHAKEMYRKGFISKLELEGLEYSKQQAELELEVKETDVDVLVRYTKEKQLQDLNGILAAKRARLASDEAALKLERSKLEREKEQLKNCVIRAETAGMAIYGTGEKWEDRPDIREGATVREDQVLLLIPDLERMQVKVGIHEAQIERVRPGQRARIDLQDKTYGGTVLSVAPMAEQGGWWNGNMVKYETIIELDTQSGLKPGMSADVIVFLAEHKDVLTIPVAAVVEHDGKFACWAKTSAGSFQRRPLELGDSDEQFLVVKSGLQEGDRVVINPIASIAEAQADALTAFRGARISGTSDETENEGDGKKSSASNAKKKGEGQGEASSAKSRISGAQILKMADKNKDGVLTRDEFAEKDRAKFDETDANSDGKVDVSELDSAITKSTAK